MENEKLGFQLGEMLSNFPAEELKRMMLHLDRHDYDVITEEKQHVVEAEKQLEEKSEEIIADNL